MAVQSTDLVIIERAGVLHKTTAGEVGALGGGGGGGVSGSAVVTAPMASLSHIETVAAVGLTPSSLAFVAIAPHADTDENSPDLLDIMTISGQAGTDTLTVTMTFAAPTSGPINLYWRA